jgi:hypothetical protein
LSHPSRRRICPEKFGGGKILVKFSGGIYENFENEKDVK